MEIRIALVVAIGVVAVGSFIGAPSLGDVVIRGTNATDGTLFIWCITHCCDSNPYRYYFTSSREKLDPATQTNN